MRRALVMVLLLAGCASTPPSDESVPIGGQPSWIEGTFSVLPGNFTTDDVSSRTLVPGPWDVLPVETVVLQSAIDGADIDMGIWLPGATSQGTSAGADAAQTATGVPPVHATPQSPTSAGADAAQTATGVPPVHATPQGATSAGADAAQTATGVPPVPVIIQASPYFARTDVPSGSQRFGEWMVEEFVPHGYAYVQLAIRSTAGSGGCDDFRGPHMTADMDQAITWLASQEWSNGNVSLIGKSYPGSTPWYAAGAGNPAVKTIVPVSGSTNAWEVYNRNGTPESRAAAIVPNYGVGAITNGDRSPQHKVENFACAEVYEAWANGVVSGATGERVTDAWWDERNSKPGVEANYRGSIFLVHGLEDWNVDPAVAIPWTQHLNDTGLVVKQWLGQWQHDWPDQGSDETKRWDFAEVLLRWFDRELKGRDVDVGPPVQVQSNDGRWRDEVAWPPKDAQPWVLYPSADALAASPPAGNALQTLTPTGPDSSLTFATGPLEAAARIAGLPEVHFTVTPSGPGGYMGAILYDEAPDGERKRIGWTGMNFRYHAGGEEPQVVVPREPITLKAQIQPMDAYVPEGHRLVLVVGAVTPSDRIMPPQRYPYDLHVGADSVLRLPIVERDAFFTPPS